MAHRRPEQPTAPPEYDNPAGCLPRLFWMAFGNIGLVLAAWSVKRSSGWSIADLTFWLLVTLLVGARYIDIVRFNGTTIHGDPATTGHLKRYVLLLLVVSAAGWAVARALGPGFP